MNALYCSWWRFISSMKRGNASRPFRLFNQSWVPGVQSVHDLHVWAISSGKNSLTVQVVGAPDRKLDEVLRQTAAFLEAEFGITHTTVHV